LDKKGVIGQNKIEKAEDLKTLKCRFQAFNISYPLEIDFNISEKQLGFKTEYEATTEKKAETKKAPK
jgi:hypothetical protein